MSDSEDWENAADDMLEDKPKEEKKEQTFADEDNVDSDEEEAKKKEAAKKEAEAKKLAEPPKQKTKAKDYDAMFEARRGKKVAAAGSSAAATNTQGLSKAAKGEALSKDAEADITEQLFAADINTEASNLKTEKNYISFAKQVSDVLYEGQTPYNIPAFFNELSRGLTKTKLTAEDMKKILNGITLMYNNKVAEEKKAQGGNKKKPSKPSLAVTKGTDNLRNNNPQMVADLMGNEDDYGDEYGEYGEEQYDASKRLPEAEYDFM